MGQHLAAARRAAGRHDCGSGGGLRLLQRCRPRGSGEGLERVADGVVHRADAVRAELGGEGVAIRDVPDDDGVDARRTRATGPGRASPARPRWLPVLQLHQHEDHRTTARRSRRSTTAAAASGPSPSTSTELGLGRGKQQAYAMGAHRLTGGGAGLDLDLLRRHPALERRVPRFDAALQHRRDGGQRDRVGLLAVGSVDVRDQHLIGHLDQGGAGDDRTAEGVGEPDRHLEVAAVGGVVAEEHQVVRRAGGLVLGDDVGDLPGDVGRPDGRGVGLDEHRGVATEGERAAELLDGVVRTDGQHGDRATGRVRHPDRQLDRAVLVVADGEPDEAAVDALGVVGEQDLPGRVRHPLDADQHVRHVIGSARCRDRAPGWRRRTRS